MGRWLLFGSVIISLLLSVLAAIPLELPCHRSGATHHEDINPFQQKQSGSPPGCRLH